MGCLTGIFNKLLNLNISNIKRKSYFYGARFEFHVNSFILWEIFPINLAPNSNLNVKLFNLNNVIVTIDWILVENFNWIYNMCVHSIKRLLLLLRFVVLLLKKRCVCDTEATLLESAAPCWDVHHNSGRFMTWIWIAAPSNNTQKGRPLFNSSHCHTIYFLSVLLMIYLVISPQQYTLVYKQFNSIKIIHVVVFFLVYVVLMGCRLYPFQVLIKTTTTETVHLI